MKRSTTRAVSVLSATAALIVGLSACGMRGVASSDEQRKAAVVELEKRGFEDPVFVADDTTNREDEMRFDAKAGNCRLLISRNANGDFGYRDTSWSEDQVKKVRELSGGSISSAVKASFIKTYGKELGWAHCLG